jgi:hypothetical protein
MYKVDWARPERRWQKQRWAIVFSTSPIIGAQFLYVLSNLTDIYALTAVSKAGADMRLCCYGLFPDLLSEIS